MQGQQLPPEMRALSRKLMVTKAALEKAKADDAKRLVEDKAALKKEGWDLDDPNAACTKDPAEF